MGKDLLVRIIMGLVLVVALEAILDRLPSIPGLARTVLVGLVGVGIPSLFVHFFEVRRRRARGLSRAS